MKTKCIVLALLGINVASGVNVRFIDETEDINAAAISEDYKVIPQRRQAIAQIMDDEEKAEKKEEKKEEPEEETKADVAKAEKKKAAAEEELIGPAGEKMRLPYGDALAKIHGIDKKELQPDRHWTKAWPQGIDDGQDDDKVLHMSREEREEKEAEVKPRYLKVRPAIEGQWPLGEIRDKKDKVIMEYGKVDDGTDDDTVLNAGLKEEGMELEHLRI